MKIKDATIMQHGSNQYYEFSSFSCNLSQGCPLEAIKVGWGIKYYIQNPEKSQLNITMFDG